MKRLRYALATITLLVTLGGSIFLGGGTGSLARAGSVHLPHAASLAGKSAQSVAVRPLGWCPILGIAC
jgi:hypothetical protein